MRLFILLLLLPVFESYKGDDLQILNQKSIIIITGDLMCHSCLEILNERILKMKKRNFNYFVLINSGRGIINRKKVIDVYKKKVNPNNFIFMTTDSIFNKFVISNNIKYFPSILLINHQKNELVLYENIFIKTRELSTIDSILKEFNKSNKKK